MKVTPSVAIPSHYHPSSQGGGEGCVINKNGIFEEGRDGVEPTSLHGSKSVNYW